MIWKLKNRVRLSTAGRPRSKRLRWGVLIGLLTLLLTFVFRVQLLAAVAAPLIFEDSLDATASVVLLHGSKEFYDEAAMRYHNGSASQVLVIKKPATRSEQLGISGSAELAAKRLIIRGIPDQAGVSVPCKDHRTWTFARVLSQWLIDHPEDRLVLVCNRFESRRTRWILDHVLAREERTRVRIRALADPSYDESNWWKQKEGQIELYKSYLALLYSCLNGDSGPSGPDWTPQEYIGLLDLGK